MATNLLGERNNTQHIYALAYNMESKQEHWIDVFIHPGEDGSGKGQF